MISNVVFFRKRYHGYIDFRREICTCYHCHKEIKINIRRIQWQICESLVRRHWRYVDRKGFRKWLCPACKLLPQYHEVTARILMKALTSKRP